MSSVHNFFCFFKVFFLSFSLKLNCTKNKLLAPPPQHWYLAIYCTLNLILIFFLQFGLGPVLLYPGRSLLLQLYRRGPRQRHQDALEAVRLRAARLRQEKHLECMREKGEA